jgi:2,3,4,5-tetrahydropyridine-2-carboxylate N-succinyltransferase
MSPRKVAAKKTTARSKKPEGPGIEELKFHIESAWERRAALTPQEIDWATRPSVERVVEGLETGEFRVAEPDGKGGWKVNEWLKKAVLLYFRTREMELIDADPAPFWDKIPLRFTGFGESQFRKLGVRVLPGTVVRRGTHLGKDVVLMPSFVNIGAYIGASTMVDTWATVGSCAQVGKHCHTLRRCGHRWRARTAAGVADDHRGPLLHRCALGGGRRRCRRPPQRDRHGGVHRPEHAHLQPRDRRNHYGYVPPGSVVVSGSLPAKDGTHSLYCAVIVKQVDAKTRAKTSINDLLRGHAECSCPHCRLLGTVIAMTRIGA